MKRREFLSALGATVSTMALPPAFAQIASPGNAAYKKLLVLVELKGANDGLNTLVPYADPAYATLRPTVQIKRDQVLLLSDRFGLHPALEPLMPLWKSGEMAAMMGLGYPQPNLSHFRSIEIWDTASKSNEYLSEGWLARAFSQVAPPKAFLADGVAIGGGDLGPLTNAKRAVSIASTDAFLRQAKLADPHGRAYNKALQHILRVEGDAQFASSQLKPKTDWKTDFPNHTLGQQVKTAMQVVSASQGVAAVHVSLGSFDTHGGQLGTHQNLLKQLAESIVAIKQASEELGRWKDTLVVTYCEFGRRAKENASNGTDHGTANVQFAFGGNVKGGLKGEYQSLTNLSGDNNFIHTADYRSLYASVLRDWWNLPSATVESVLGGKYASLGFV
ncbi:MAG: DUF1501 domain-containing protein [Casimicrobium sp.]